MVQKSNNARRFPGESNRYRPDLASKRRQEAQERKDIYDSLTPKQKLERLDVKFGVGQGAKKERLKLQLLIQTNAGQHKSNKTSNAEIENLDTATLSPEVMAEIEAINDDMNNKKKLKAKDRRARDKKSFN